ncbi:ribosomal protection-like ABC-F family protein [Micromonospora sp. C28ISP2-4]|uniref:ribosomal protection-like ABC-F family protein n=1 Tax=Micromonospora sp. C28ISP2-4 TaxID=3059523 RepID=UPI0026748D2D|nr:ABC-F family ATP-binding cassette domain-containing protein [Micromonospora sp. C28ISP2-4]MDO3687736.1 ABC-F family ATP-binding cassette domain-containing protein [Micromonospora sp. C28ISP2-4]
MTHSQSSPSRPHRVCAIRGATVRFAERVVLAEVDLAVGPAERIAVIGDNGAGKSALLGALAGTLRLTAGERMVQLPGGVAFAEQQPRFRPGASVADALDDLLGDIRELEAEILRAAEQLARAGSDERDALSAEVSAAMDRFEARDGYQLDQKLASDLDRLGLGDLDRSRPVLTLSGGERARLALAAALASEAELLLLDEPTNDLDDAGIAWLEDRLAMHRGALVVVTHDRVLLDRLATDIVHIERGGLRRYGDGYAGYLTARASEQRRLLHEYEAWRQDLARQEALVTANAFRLDAIPRKMGRALFGHAAFRARGRDHGSMGRIRMAKSRIDRLRAEPAPRPADPLRFAPSFAEPAAGEKAVLIRAEGVRLDGDGPRLRLDALDVSAGDRLLISGPNGAGKTTLLQVLAGELAPPQGTVQQRSGLRIAWLRQAITHGSRATLLDAFAAGTGTYRDHAADELLRVGLFHPDDLHRQVAHLSVGQRRRLELALAVTRPSDVLLLDEPTNHLAPELLEQLENALPDYTGAVLTVTHDRRWRERAGASARVRRIHVAPGGLVRLPDPPGDERRGRSGGNTETSSS